MSRTRPTVPVPVPTDPAAPAAVNRAARRGRAQKQPDTVHTGVSGRPRTAQGRRVVPVRRTG